MTLEPDVERLLRRAMELNQESFKTTLNRAIRRGLAGMEGELDDVPFVVEPKDMGLRPGVDAARLQEVADAMEVDAYLDLSRRLETRKADVRRDCSGR